MKKVLSSMPAQAALLLVLGCFALATLLPGCGSNPAGPSGAGSTTSTTTTPSVSSGTATVYGQIIDQDSNLPIQDSNAQIVVQLYKENTLVKSQTALGNNSFVFSDVAGGIYTLYAYDAAAVPVYSKNFSIVQATVNTAIAVNLKLRKRRPLPQPPD